MNEAKIMKWHFISFENVKLSQLIEVEKTYWINLISYIKKLTWLSLHIGRLYRQIFFFLSFVFFFFLKLLLNQIDPVEINKLFLKKNLAKTQFLVRNEELTDTGVEWELC